MLPAPVESEMRRSASSTLAVYTANCRGVCDDLKEHSGISETALPHFAAFN